MTPWRPMLGLAMLGLALGLSQPGAAEPPPKAVAGLWAIAIAIEQPRTRCRWEGHVRLVQIGRRLTGSGKAKAVGRAPRCPPLEGNIDGKVDGNGVRFGFAMGRLGVAEFEGVLGDGGRTLAGRWRGRAASGLWWAERALECFRVKLDQFDGAHGLPG